MPESAQQHWDSIYNTKPDHELSWHESEPIVSLELIKRHVCPGAHVIDIGGGASGLAGHLLEAGIGAVTVLDISAAAIARSQARHSGVGGIHWVVADILNAGHLGLFDAWHDRAVFHFLTSEADRTVYARLAARSVRSGGHLILGTFAIDGPEKCSGLPVSRYDAETLARPFSPIFSLVHEVRHVHTTPWGTQQPFCFVVLKRNADGMVEAASTASGDEQIQADANCE